MRLKTACVGLMMVLASCGQAPSDQAAGAPMATDGNAASQVAFTYFYGFRLPAKRIGAVQDWHADGCERLGIARCRITGLTYNVDDGGSVDASLTVALERSIARRFGRAGVETVEQAGGALTGARIEGESITPQLTGAETARGDMAGERARIDAELARNDLGAAERAELQRQRAALDENRRAARDEAAGARSRLAATPITFSYRSGSGAGIGARFADALDLAAASAANTLIVLLQVLAVIGPPIVLLLILLWLWLRWGLPVFQRWTRKPPA